jgi:tetratricopeptide (TPR) repeat protein
MGKSTTDQELESSTAIVEAPSKTEESDRSAEIERAPSERKSSVDETASRKTKSENQSDSHTSYAQSLLKRWEQYHQRKDLDRAIAYFERDLSKLPYTPSQARYSVVTSLAEALYARFNKYNAYDEDIVQAIRYWEDAYGLLIVLRRKPKSV